MPYDRRPADPIAPGLLVELKAQQAELAAKVRLHDEFEGTAAGDIELVAGVDCGFEDDGATALAAVVVMRRSDFGVVESYRARTPVTFPYVPGFLSFRELPAVELAWKNLRTRPQAVFVDGLGTAHPRRLGIAAHLGVTFDIPALGVAKSLLVGEHAPLALAPGAVEKLWHRGDDVGWVLRSKARCNPLVVSAGHRITHDTALSLVRSFLASYRLPEPTRLADRLTNSRYRTRTDTVEPLAP